MQLEITLSLFVRYIYFRSELPVDNIGLDIVKIFNK